MQQILSSLSNVLNGTENAGQLNSAFKNAWDLFSGLSSWQHFRLLQFAFKSAWYGLSAQLTWWRVTWAGTKATAADLHAELDIKDFLNWETSEHERYLEGVHYKINAFLGQSAANFYTFMSVAQDATTEDIWKAYIRMSAEAALDFSAQSTHATTRADLLAIVLDILADETKRGKYNKVLERIIIRAATKPYWLWSFVKNIIFG